MAEIKVYDPTNLDSSEWRQLQGISRDALTSTLDRTQDEIDALVAWETPDIFYASHINPNTLVGERYNANQSYTKPRVAVATEAGEPIGFAYSAHNVSGTSEINRRVKRLTLAKNYLWLREIAVGPNFQRQGVAAEIGKALLKDALPLQPPTTYVWPDEIDFLQGALQSVGFHATGEQDVKLFGENSAPVRQVRMQAKSARAVLRML